MASSNNIDPKAAMAIADAATQSKNLVLGLLLCTFFGSAGLIYTSCLLGIIGLCLEIVVWVIALFTFGLGFLLIIPWHIFSVIAVLILIPMHNERLKDNIRRNLS